MSAKPFPIAEFLRLCERVKNGELDHLNRPSRWLIANGLIEATDHVTEQLSDEGQSEMMRMGAAEGRGGQG